MSTAATLQLSELMITVKRPVDRHVDPGFFQEACWLVVCQHQSLHHDRYEDWSNVTVVAGQDDAGMNSRIFITIPIEHDENGVNDQLKVMMTRKLHDLLTDITVISIGFNH